MLELGMDAGTAVSNARRIADEVLAATDGHRSIAPFSSRPGGLTREDACRVTPYLRAAFEARGETVVGRKIGFTNRNIWPEYGVYAPNWGYVTDRTTRALDNTTGQRAADFVEPRIEPEIMFGLASAPSSGMDEAALLTCIDWVALGYEIVQSIYPGWKFTPPDTVAANALHGALFVGTRHAIAPRHAQWLNELACFEVELSCNGELVERGSGANVLGSPFCALRHLVGLLAEDAHHPPLAAGEIVSTGTLTRALPLKAGEIWTARATGIPLEPISLRFT
jgi:2-oxo-3-hexenedioate decarboxylase